MTLAFFNLNTRPKNANYCSMDATNPNIQHPTSDISIPPRKYKTVIVEVWDKCFKDDVFGHSAQLAYYFLFALFPMLIFLTALVGYLPVPHSLENLIDYLSQVLPPAATVLLRTTVKEITDKPRGGLLSFGLAATIWAASSGIHALTNSLNIAYGVKATRPWWRERILALSLTFGISMFVICSLGLIFISDSTGARLANYFKFSSGLRSFFSLLHFPFLIVSVWFGLELIYFIAPNLKRKWKWFTPGAIFALVTWLTISFLFKYYVVRISNYTLTYGSLGSVIVLMLWLYFTSMAILVGGEINGVVEERNREKANAR
jgi:membrane protein